VSLYEKDYQRRLFQKQDGNALVMLISINLVVFVLFSLVSLFYFFTYPEVTAKLEFDNDFYNNLALPASLTAIAHKPWTIITHMIYHANVWHIISNMLWLWAFGYIMQDLTGNGKIIPVFFYAAFGGAIAFVAAFHLIPTLNQVVDNANAVGASAGVMGIAVATTMIAPGYRIFPMLNGGIPLWVLTMIFLIIDLATIPSNNAGGHIAHLGGAFAGFLFIFFMRRGHDGSIWMNNFYDWISNLFNPDRPRKKSARQQLFYNSKTQPFTKTPNLTQQKIDEILDKINQKGYSHLSEEEKELLKRASQEDL
jgi:membrane associated rhomboid family serine protease